VSVFEVTKRFESNYNPYPENESPSPHKARRGIRRFYEYKLYDGGNNAKLELQMVYHTFFKSC